MLKQHGGAVMKGEGEKQTARNTAGENRGFWKGRRRVRVGSQNSEVEGRGKGREETSSNRRRPGHESGA